MFGCSTADQDNWNKLATLDTRGLVAYPFTTHTADHTGSYDLVSSADLTGALGTISLAVLTERNLAETYLAAVVAAPDEASAEAAAAPYLT
jgi:adenosylcobinamide amidohydrolase